MTEPVVPINPVPFAFQAARMGLSAREALAALRDAGGAIRDATWFRVYAEVKAQLAINVLEADALSVGIPQAGHIGVQTTKNATGYMQYVSVYIRDRDTGVVSQRAFAVRGQTLVTREAAVRKGFDAYAAEATPSGNYGGQQIIGASYTGTAQLVPEINTEDEL